MPWVLWKPLEERGREATQSEAQVTDMSWSCCLSGQVLLRGAKGQVGLEGALHPGLCARFLCAKPSWGACLGQPMRWEGPAQLSPIS